MTFPLSSSFLFHLVPNSFFFSFVVFPNRQKDLTIKTDIFFMDVSLGKKHASYSWWNLTLLKTVFTDFPIVFDASCAHHASCAQTNIYIFCYVFDGWLIEETDLVCQVRSRVLSRRVCYFIKKWIWQITRKCSCYHVENIGLDLSKERQNSKRNFIRVVWKYWWNSKIFSQAQVFFNILQTLRKHCRLEINKQRRM